MASAAGKRYVRQISRQLRCCPRKQRAEFLDRITRDVQQYETQQGAVTSEALAKEYGDPALVAAEYIQSMGAEACSGYAVRFTERLWMLCAGLLAVIVLLTGYLAYQVKAARDFQHAVIEVSTTTQTLWEMTDQEWTASGAENTPDENGKV